MKKEKQESSLKEAELSNEHPTVVIKEQLNLEKVESLEPTDCDTLAENVEYIIVDKVEEEEGISEESADLSDEIMKKQMN